MLFLCFAGNNYYPSGGWDDFQGAYPTVEAAVEKAESLEYCDWYHVVDATTLTVVNYNGFPSREKCKDSNRGY